MLMIGCKFSSLFLSLASERATDSFSGGGGGGGGGIGWHAFRYT